MTESIKTPTREEAIKDIEETEKEIAQLVVKAVLFPRLASWYRNQIKERKDFIKKLKEQYNIE